MQRNIVHHFTYLHPPEVVWEYLTDAGKLAQWLMPNDIKPVMGHKFRFQSKPMPRFGFDGIVHCEVLEVITNKRLVYTWKGGMLDTVVVWTLAATAEGTVLTLEHRGFKGLKNMLPYLIMSGGWAKIGKRLSKQLSQ